MIAHETIVVASFLRSQSLSGKFDTYNSFMNAMGKLDDFDYLFFVSEGSKFEIHSTVDLNREEKNRIKKFLLNMVEFYGRN